MKRKMYETLRNKIISNPSTGFWLRNAIISLEKRDPVDVYLDVEALKELMELRMGASLTEVK